MKKAIVLGGTHDHIRLIEILREKGYYIYLIDYLDNPPAKIYSDEFIKESTLDIDVVTNIAKRIQPDLLMVACIDQPLLTMANVCENLNLPCHISFQTALELTNKAYMKIKFIENQIPTSTFIVQNAFDKKSVSGLKFPLVGKPVDSNSSKGITKAKTMEELEIAAKIAFRESRDKRIIIEEFLEGEEFSVDAMVKNGEPTILLVTKNNKSKQNLNSFTITQSYFPATSDPVLLTSIQEIVRKIVLAYNIRNSPLLVQMIHNNGELNVIEFSARIGGGSKHHLIKKLTGFDILKYFVEILLGENEDVVIKQYYNFGSINYIYATNGIIGGFKGFDELVSTGIIDDYYLYKTIGMKITNHIASSDRPAGYLITDNDFTDFEENLSCALGFLDIVDPNGESIIIKNII